MGNIVIFKGKKQKEEGGGTQLFSGKGVQPGFLKCGAGELLFASERGGL